jgi:hypothetical protein
MSPRRPARGGIPITDLLRREVPAMEKQLLATRRRARAPFRAAQVRPGDSDMIPIFPAASPLAL